MKRRRLAFACLCGAMAGAALWQTRHSAAAPPDTSPSVSVPGLFAALAPRLAAALANEPREPEILEMWRDVLADKQMGAGVGWFHSGEFRHGWSWLSERFDANRDGAIDVDELPFESAWFDRLDRDRDGIIRPDDVDWRESAEGMRGVRGVARWFLPLDGNENGRISMEEWDTAFDRLAGDRDSLTTEDLARFLQGGRTLEGNAPPSNRGKRPPREIMIQWMLSGQLGSMWEGPRINQEAPDFDLPLHRGGGHVRLADFRGQKPVVLIFGSFSCGPFRSQVGLLEDLHARYGERAQFLAVYVREAHPYVEAHGAFNDGAVDIRQAANLDERLQAADRCSKVLEISMPLLVDDMLDSTAKAYSGVPSRLYVIDRDGFVTYKSGRGPGGTLARELEQGLLFTLLDE